MTLGGGVNFVNGGGWVGVFGGIIKSVDSGTVSVFHVFDPFSTFHRLDMCFIVPFFINFIDKKLSS